MTHAKHSKGGINVAEKDSSIELWHKRLGHLSEKGLQILSKKQLLPGAKAVDLINLSPSVPLEGDVPQRVWTGKEVSYEHLRVFGCKAYVHVPKDEREKLDEKAKPCIFMGYGREEFGYRLWDPIARKIIRSRDVIFLEDETSEDVERVEKKKNTAAGPVNLEPISPSQMHENVEEVVHDEPQGALDQEVQGEEQLEQEEQVEEEQPLPEPRKSTRDRKSSTWSKHIDVRYHWIRDVLEEKLLELNKVHTDDNGSDMMTKSLPSGKHIFCRDEAGLVLPPI
ncbi:unnamed protein product [Linum trigynum]|uniref:GAG-pre-integrase domain-containing protein n=1 Tax=Linum trigynum TaxID=586398 RepID=A0AAV2GDE7_9ROSI